MSYAANLLKEDIKSIYLAVIRPRRYAASWTVDSGTKYTTSFDYGNVTNVWNGIEAQTLASTSALGDGEWYYDFNANTLYLDIGSDPSAEEIVVEYEIFIGTFDANWYRDPTDDTTRQVYWSPLIVSSPTVNVSSGQSLIGYFPTSSSQLVLSNATHFFEKHIYDSSFNDARVLIYHRLGKEQTDNFKLIFSGNVGGDLSYNDTNLSMTIYDSQVAFESEFRIISKVITENDYKSFYEASPFLTIDPAFIGRPIRKVYGVKDNFLAVNYDYDEVADPGKNRSWFLGANEDIDTEGVVKEPVVSNGSSSTTRTYVASADGFRFDDDIYFFKLGTPGFFATITAINKTGDNYIEHTAIGSTASTDYEVWRTKVGWVKIIQDGVPYRLTQGSQYSSFIVSASNFRLDAFSIDTLTESLLGINTLDITKDLIVCRYYGSKAIAEIGGSKFGGDSVESGNLTNPVGIIYDILTLRIGIPEDEINTDNFEAMLLLVDDDLGFSVPENLRGDFPRNKDLLVSVLKSSLLRLYKGDDNKWALSKVEPFTASDKTIEDTDILLRSFDYSFNYQDVYSDIFIDYDRKEVGDYGSTEENFTSIRKLSLVAKNLHKIQKQITIKSYHFVASQAEAFATKIKAIFGERSGKIKFDTKYRFFNSEVGDITTITRDRMPGYAFEQDTDRLRNGVIISTVKKRDSITIELDDQKGIEDNSGDF